jgi:hypothetical protein
MAMKVYQLRATGAIRGFYEIRSIFSKKIFKSRKKALAHEPEFRKLAANEKDFFTLEEPVKITIQELELHGISLIRIDFPGGGSNGD